MQALLRQLQVSMTDTCVPYQTAYQPTSGEHLAWGDTGAVAYANAALGARSNFEAGPFSLLAALTGRTPAYGFHLSENRRANVICRITARMRDYADWGALGKIAGTRFRGYTTVPVFDIAGARPTGDDLKHLAASLASHGSQAMFHVVGSTPEAGTLEAAVADCDVTAETTIDQNHLDAAFTPATGPRAVQLVVFTAPQLSLAELRTIADLLASRRVHPDVTVIVTANRAVLADADNHGVSVALRDAIWVGDGSTLSGHDIVIENGTITRVQPTQPQTADADMATSMPRADGSSPA